MVDQHPIPGKSAVLCLIAYGSNLSVGGQGPQDLVETALCELAKRGVRILQQSGHFRSSAWPVGSGPDFVNGVVLAETEHEPEALLAVLHDIEAQLGRTRRTRWEARVIDLDLLDYGGQVLPDARTFARWRDLPAERQAQAAPGRIILPHPRIEDRAFVLVPIAAVAPDWRHPVTDAHVSDLIAALNQNDRDDVRPLDPE